MVRAVLLHEIVVFVIARNYFPWILCSPEITIDNDWWGTFLGVILVILLHLRSFWFTMTIETQFRPNKDPECRRYLIHSQALYRVLREQMTTLRYETPHNDTSDRK